MEFNRAICVGTVAPATETELDEASAWLRANGAPASFPIGRLSRVKTHNGP